MKESHGDWLAVEHNSTVANDLKQKYGEKDLSSNPRQTDNLLFRYLWHPLPDGGQAGWHRGDQGRKVPCYWQGSCTGCQGLEGLLTEG